MLMSRIDVMNVVKWMFKVLVTNVERVFVCLVLAVNCFHITTIAIIPYVEVVPIQSTKNYNY